LNEYRELFKKGEIKEPIVDFILEKYKGNSFQNWKNNLLEKYYDENLISRIGSLRKHWNLTYNIKLDKTVQTNLFRIVSSYLDQGISIWNFPAHKEGFLKSFRELEKRTSISFFKHRRAKNLLQNKQTTLLDLLHLVVGKETLFETYLYDQQFTHTGWSGMVSVLEQNPEQLYDTKKICLHDFIFIELLLEIDFLDDKFGENWIPLGLKIEEKTNDLFGEIPYSELFEVYKLWQESYEWSYYNQVLLGVQKGKTSKFENKNTSFQALFCIDDRECSIRRYVEKIDKNSKTYGTAGFFGVEFFYQPIGSKFYSKLCPAPITPTFLIKEIGNEKKLEKDLLFSEHSHSLVKGWVASQTLGFLSGLKLFSNIFNPKMSSTTTSSFKHLPLETSLQIEYSEEIQNENGLQVGFKIEEMVNRVEALLKSIGLVSDFSSIVYLIAHGATSTNNTHYAGYDCGACCGRPGTVNSMVMAFMVNHQKVREILKTRGILIPETTTFIAGLHDTTRDEIIFYNTDKLSQEHKNFHKKNEEVFNQALKLNAKERSRRFDLIDSNLKVDEIYEKVKLRSVSLFEPRPELNHATNALCVVGRRDVSKHLFLDRRSFMNSFDYQVDPIGEYLIGILKAVAPVCGGINLEYYFSRVDNQKLGAGTKLPHNVVGLIGVANGINGDLRPGLPSQMIEVHSPVRLLVLVEHFPEVIFNAITAFDTTYEWFKNEWVRLVSVHPENGKMYIFENEKFEEFQPIQEELKTISNDEELIHSYSENLPVYLINN
jgi:uncharacterized protein YbcC (UPF0753/DUF2309 family)